MEHALSLDNVRLDEMGRIAQDLDCVRCGYNLRGLEPRASCPECDEAVARALRGELLRFADPAWVTSLSAGVVWLVVGLTGMFVGDLLGRIFIVQIGPAAHTVAVLGFGALAMAGL